MNKENTEKLFNDFPEIFRDKDKPASESLVCFGFEYNDGWFNLTYELCENIMEYCNNNNIKPPTAFQMKEKFGGLRFYYDGREEWSDENHDEISKFIDEAEDKSYKTCEICGEVGEPRKGGWIKTLCEECK
jgi:hypothetical protein